MQLPRIDLDIQAHDVLWTDDSSRYQAAARWIAEQYNLQRFVVSISIVSDAAIHRINREHLQHDWPTDVISFVFDNDENSVNGEVIASHDTASRLSPDAGWSASDELLLYIVHGLLHLVGLDDIDESDRTEMRQVERDCMLALAVTGAETMLDRWDDVAY